MAMNMSGSFSKLRRTKKYDYTIFSNIAEASACCFMVWPLLAELAE